LPAVKSQSRGKSSRQHVRCPHKDGKRNPRRTQKPFCRKNVFDNSQLQHKTKRSCQYGPASKGQADFLALAEEIAGKKTSLKQHQKLVTSLTDQLNSISFTADHLLKETKQNFKPATEIKEIKNPAAAPAPTLETKLANYYGVSQLGDAVAFVSLYPNAQTIQIAGDFNNWQPKNTHMEKVGQSGVWQAKIKLPKGFYRYRLVVDGKWQQDPYNNRTELNQFGEFNSVLEVH